MQSNVPRSHMCGGVGQMISLTRDLYPGTARGRSDRHPAGLSCVSTADIEMSGMQKGQRVAPRSVREGCVFV